MSIPLPSAEEGSENTSATGNVRGAIAEQIRSFAVTGQNVEKAKVANFHVANYYIIC